MKSPEFLTIPLEALHCRSCALRIERRLQREPGVKAARVSAAARLAEVQLASEARLPEIYASLRSALAEPVVTSISIPLAGVAGAEQQARALERDLRELPGVLEAYVDLSTGELFVSYLPGVADADLIRREVGLHGWTAARPGPGSHTRDDTQQRERRKLLLLGSIATVAAALASAIAAAAPIATADPLVGIAPLIRPLLRQAIALQAPVAHAVLALLTILVITIGLKGLIRASWVDFRSRVATGRQLGVLAVLVLAIGSIPALVAAFRGQVLPSFWSTALWSEAFFLLTLAHGEKVRWREREASAAAPRPRLLDLAARRPMKIEQRGDLLSGWTVVATFLIAFLTAGAWLSASLASWGVALLAFASVLLVAAPGAPAVAGALLARRAAIGLQRRGTMVSAATAFERAAEAKAAAFSWRGGIAHETISIQEIVLLHGITQDELFAAAAAACGDSTGAACELIRERAMKPAVTENEHLLGNAEMMENRNVDLTPLREEIERFESEARQVLIVARGRAPIGALVLGSEPRPNGRDVSEALRKRGLRLVLATGHTERSAAAAARRAGIERFAPGLDASQKGELVRQLHEEAGPVMFVGDGGDVLARTRASLGVVFGPAGTPPRDDVQIENGELGSVVDFIGSGRTLLDEVPRRHVTSILWHLGGFAFAAGALVPLDLLPSPSLAALAALIWSVWSSRPAKEVAR